MADTGAEELLPCPFCGGPMLLTCTVPPMVASLFDKLHEDSRRWAASCTACNYSLMPRASRDAAVAHGRMRKAVDGGGA